MQTQSDTIERITKEELKQRLSRGEDLVIVDARERHVFAVSNIKPKDSLHIPPGLFNLNPGQLPKDKPIVAACT